MATLGKMRFEAWHRTEHEVLQKMCSNCFASILACDHTCMSLGFACDILRRVLSPKDRGQVLWVPPEEFWPILGTAVEGTACCLLPRTAVSCSGFTTKPVRRTRTGTFLHKTCWFYRQGEIPCISVRSRKDTYSM